MLYLLAKLIAKFSFLSVYRKVYLINEDNVPGDRAALIACNHPAGFVEPLVIGGYIKHRIYFLVRGDVFKKGWANFLLRGIHCIPIFRFRDGFSSMRKNNETINETVDILGKKKPLIVFAEGSTKQVRYVRPIQKGTIRLAFDTYSKFPESDPCIVPSVIHFSVPEFYRSEVIMEYGAPISVADYADLYQEHNAKGIKKLLDDVNTAMQEMSIKIDPAFSTKDADKVLEIARSSARDKNIFPIINKVPQAIQRDTEHLAGQTFNNLNDDEKKSLLHDIDSLKSKLNSNNISYDQITGRTKAQWFNVLLLIIGFFPFIIGRVLNIIPIKLGQYFARTKVKKIEFKAVMKLCSFLIMYPFYWMFVAIIIGVISWKFTLLAILLPALGWFSYLYEGQWKDFKRNLSWGKLDEGSQQEFSQVYERIVGSLGLSNI